MSETSKFNLLQTVTLYIFALLIFILSVPGTIALRNILAVSLLVILIRYWIQAKISIKPILSDKNLRDTLIILFVITIYILIHSLFIADEVNWSLSQYRTQWIYPMIYFMIGVSLAYLASYNKYFKVEALITFLFFSLFIHIIYIDAVALFNYFETGNLITRYGGLTKSPVLSSYIVNILISMIIVEFIFRLKNKKRILQIGSFWLVFFLFLCIFASIIAGMRFGAISIFFMSFGILLILIIVNKNLNKKTKGLVSMFFLILCTLPLLYNAKTDKRWYSLIETIPIAIDTENYTYWRDNENPPVLKNGDIVDHSNYMRIAWAVRGIKYIKSDIFGIGYGKNVFGHAIQKYENSPKSIRGSHSHSGVIDFTIGVGILGLLLWLYFIGKIIVSMALMYANYSNYFSLFSLFFTSSFFIRSLVDSNMRDHMFKQFFLILGIVLTLAAFQNHKKNNDS